MMTGKEEVVAIWLGYFNSQEEFDDFIAEDYDLEKEDEDDYGVSRFMKKFGLEWIDHDFMECSFQENTTSYAKLLNEHSYLSKCANKPSTVETKYNCAVLIYDCEYNGEIISCEENNNFLEFFDNLLYEKVIDTRW